MQFVGATFWGLMAVDRELVLPAKLDPYFPSWINHIMHTNIVICQLLETVTSDRKYPTFKTGIPSLFVFQSAYIGWWVFVYRYFFLASPYSLFVTIIEPVWTYGLGTVWFNKAIEFLYNPIPSISTILIEITNSLDCVSNSTSGINVLFVKDPASIHSKLETYTNSLDRDLCSLHIPKALP